MKFRNVIILSASIPVIVIFMSAIASQAIALHYSKIQIKSFTDDLFNKQTMFAKLIIQIISQQMNSEIQKFPIGLYILNQLHSKISAGNVIINPLYRDSHMHTEMLYQNRADPELMAIFKQNKFATSNWYHINVTDVSQLSQTGRDILRNVSVLNPLQRMFKYTNLIDLVGSNRRIKFNNIIQGYSFDGIFYGNSYNSTYSNFAVDCLPGKFKYDVRCRYWYLGSLNQTSVIMFSPELLYMDDQPSLASVVCQRQLRYNSTLQQDEVYLVACFSLRLSFLSNYFQHFSSKQTFIIDPISQTVVYDSRQPTGMESIINFSNLELNNLEDQEQAKQINQTIQSIYGNKILKNYSKSDLLDFQNLTTSQQLINYDRNGTKYLAILNPIIYFDKLPCFSGVQQIQPKGFEAKIAYLQIFLITDEDLRKQSNSLEKQFEIFFSIFGIIQLIFLGMSICFTLIYSYRLINLLEDPIKHLTTVLQKLTLEIQSDDLFDIFYNFQMNSKEIFSSKETCELYECFEIVFQMLVQTTTSFFQENQNQTLLTLNQQIQFFKQFQNNYAVGIIHNNIGCLLLSEQHYFEAMEHFSSSILCSQYEINRFCLSNPISSISNNLMNFAQSDELYQFQDKTKNERRTIFELQTQKKNLTRQLIEGKSHNISIQFHKPQLFSNTLITPNLKHNSLVTTNITSNNLHQVHSNLQLNQRPSSSDQSKLNERQNMSNNKLEEVNRELDIHPFSDKLLQQTERRNCEQIDELMKNCNITEQTKTKELILQMQDTPNSNREDLMLQFQKAKEQVKQLFEMYYYRKKNYIIALIAFQEHHDYLVKKRKYYFQKDYDFWKELKKLLKQLLKIAKNLEIFETERVEILGVLSKCYFKMEEDTKSQTILSVCKQHFHELMSKNNKSGNQSKSDQNLQKNIKANSSHEQIITHKPMKVLDLNTLHKHSELNKESDFTTNHQQQHRHSKDMVSQMQSDIQLKQKLQNNNEITTFLNGEKIISSFNRLENNQVINLSSQQQSNNVSQFDDKTLIDHLNKEKNKKQSYIQSLSDNNLRAQNKDISSIQQITSNTKLDPTLQEPIINQKKGFLDKFYRFFTFFLRKPQAQEAKSSFNGSGIHLNTLNNHKASANNRLQSFRNSHFFQKNNNDSNLIIEKVNKTTVQNNQCVEQLFQNKRNAEERKKNNNHQEMIKKTLEHTIVYTQVEYLINCSKFYEASLLLTQMLETYQFMRSHYPFKIVYSLKEILDNHRISSSEFNTFYEQYNTRFNINLSFIFQNENDNNIIEQRNNIFDNTKQNPTHTNMYNNLNRQSLLQSIKPLQLLSNLMNDVLVQEEDKISVTINHSSEHIQTYMKTVKMKVVKPLVSVLIQEIYNLTQSQQITLHTNSLPFTEQTDYIEYLQTQNYRSFHNYYRKEDREISNTQQQQCSQQPITFTQQLDEQIKSNNNIDNTYDKLFSLNNIQNITDLNMLSQNQLCLPDYQLSLYNSNQNSRQFQSLEQHSEFIGSPLLLKFQSKSKLNYTKPHIKNSEGNLKLSEEEEEKEDSQSKSGSSSSNSPNSKTDNANQSPHTHKNVFSFLKDRDQPLNENSQYQFKVFRRVGDYNDLVNCSFNDLEDGQKDEKEEMDQINKNSGDYQNRIFHLSLRKVVIENYLETHDFKSQENHFKQRYPSQCRQINEYTQLLEFNYLNNYKFKKQKNMIIYTTFQVEIYENTLFEKLCKCLYELNIFLIIYSQKRNINFLEQQPNQAYYLNGKKIIKIFYSIQAIDHFLHAQRSNGCGYLYPTYIQHF